MTPIVTRFIILFLVFLQSVAPLVHAHSGYTTQQSGIHLPGLEFITAQPGAPILSSLTTTAQNEGTLVCVTAGLQLKQSSLIDKVHQPWFFIANESPDMTFNPFLSDFLPATFSLPLTPGSNPGFPRAPPA